MRYERLRRVDELLKREISAFCERNIARELTGLLTITQVKTSSDLRHARVYESVLGPPAAAETALDRLKQYRPDMQHQIAVAVQLKFTPVLTFHTDHSPEHGDHVLSILDELHLLDPEPGEPAPPTDEPT